MEEALVSLMETYLERFDPANLKKRLPMEIAFHRELLRRMGPEQMIQFSALELGDRPIAQHFGFSYNGVYHWVRPRLIRFTRNTLRGCAPLPSD